jgi:predicted XRE-type DNA-binding protein
MGDTRFPEEVGVRNQDAKAGDRTVAAAAEPATQLEALDEDEPFEFYTDSANPFRDSNLPHADLLLLKSDLRIEISHILTREGLSTRDAEARTGVSHSEFSRIRRPESRRFTVDRLMIILEKLGYDVEVSVRVSKWDGSPRGPVLTRLEKGVSLRSVLGEPPDQDAAGIAGVGEGTGEVRQV